MNKFFERFGLFLSLLLAMYSFFIVFYSYLIPYISWLPASFRYIFDQVHLIRAIHLCLVVLAIGFLSFKYPSNFRGNVILTILSFPVVLAFSKFTPTVFPIILLIWFLTFPTEAILTKIRSEKFWIFRFATLLPILASTIYLIHDYEAILYRVVFATEIDTVIGFLILITLLYATSIAISWPLPAIILCFLLYLFYGQIIPQPVGHFVFDHSTAFAKLWMETEAGIYGLPLGVSAKYVVYFTILAGIMEVLGFTAIVSRLALSFLGKAPQGVGRASTAYSAMMGMISGSGVAVTTTVGTTMLPAFKKRGYDEEFSAAFIAGTGAAALITPPILGAAAFIMMEVVGIDYISMIIMTILPAAIYFLSLQVYLELYSKKIASKLQNAKLEELERLSKKEFVRLSIVFIPIAVLIVMVARGSTISLSVVTATFLTIILSLFLKETRKNIKKLLQGFARGALHVTPVALACGCAGIVLHVLLVTGLGLKIEQVVTFLSMGNFYFLLILLAGFTLLLGMGVPPVASYMIASVLIAPVTIKFAIMHGFYEFTAKIAVHMFTFYYAVLAEVTPPVALTAFAAAALVRKDPLRVGFLAAKIALIKYILGFSFVVAPVGAALLITPYLNDPLNIVLRFAFVCASVLFINVATVGYLSSEVKKVLRVSSFFAGILLLLPIYELNLAGILLGGLLVFILNRER